MKSKTMSSIITMAIMLFVFAATIGSAAAVPSATRTLPAPVAPGEEFQITISYSDIGMMGQVNETLPDGFTYVSSSLSSGVVPDTNWVKFTLLGGSSFTYNVTASDVAGTYTFSGTIKDEDKTAAVIGGNTSIDVISTSAVSATRTLPAPVAPGEEFQITISYSDIGMMGQVNETLPDGFTYVSSSLSSGVVPDTNWVKFTLLGGSSFTYNVTASDVAGTYTFSGTIKDEDKTAAVIGGNTDVAVGPAAPTLTWTTEPPTQVEQGDDVTFDVSFSESADYYFRVENSTGDVVWRYPETGTGSAMNPGERTWTTTTDTPTGDYTIIININGADNSDTKPVTVTKPDAAALASITISPPSCTLDIGDSQPFAAACTDTDGNGMICPTLTWTSTDMTVGTITSAGVFTASEEGATTITASADGVTSNDATVTVYPLGAVIVTLYEGWNLIAVPVNDPDADTAAELASKIAGCKEVVMWDAAEDEYVTYTKIDGDWTGTDFAITGGMGIFVNVEGAATVGFTGDAWS